MGHQGWASGLLLLSLLGCAVVGDVRHHRIPTRIELCKDEAGSWLHNHYDDKAKLFTLQLYLSDSVVSTKFEQSESKATLGSGWFFPNTGRELHGLPALPKKRISIIVNYVDDTWRDRSVLV